jgi:UDP-N-acetylmuramoyl-tripeptide--D-alanyl-D-alanine ligase
VELSLRTFGAHNARNAAAALAVGQRLGIPVQGMVEALEEVAPVGDRGRVVERDGVLIIADCYNANPGSMEAALRSLAGLRAHRPGKLVAVVGDMLELGPTATELHGEVGILAAKLGLDGLAAVGPLSRNAAETAGKVGLATHHTDDDVEATVAWVQQQLGDDGGAVLVKASRGMALERVVNGLT